MSIQHKNYIIGLDGMRGFAIFMAFTYHLFESFFRGTRTFDSTGALYHPATYPEYATLFFAFSMRLSIHLFFLVSGYVIHAIYSKRNFTPSYAFKFSIKRYTRMLPAYAVSIIFVILGGFLVGRINSVDFLDVFTHLLFINNFFDKYSFSLQAIYWSMAVEFQFYIMYAILRLLLRDKFNLNYTFIFFLLLSLGYRIYIYTPQTAEHLHWVLMDNPFLRFSDWLMGAMLFEHREKLFKIRFKPLWFVGLFLLASFMDYFGFTSTVLVDFVGCIGMAAILLYAVQYKFEPAFFRFVGVMSYSFYLYHFMAYSMVDKFGMMLLGYERVASWERFGVFLIAIPISLGVGFMMYKLIEEPAVNFFKDKFK